MSELMTIFLAGDMMTGRGIDQILPHPSNPVLYESYVKYAGGYLELAERINGPIPRPVDFLYIWGEALEEMERQAAQVRIVNLETSITCSNDYWKGKGINYRMHPGNIPCLTAAQIDCCALANNHVLDWGYDGLAETLETLQKAGIKGAGAGYNLPSASEPAIIDVPAKGRIVVFSFSTMSCGIPGSWAATENKAGVNLLQDISPATAMQIKARVEAIKQPRDLVIASLHWGGNWGYVISAEQQEFAHQLIDKASVDVVHGHSPHHVKGIEVYKGKLILYGCGDFITDYEGISGYESYRDDLGLMYFPTLDLDSGKLIALKMTPTQIKKFKVNRASALDAKWLEIILNREGRLLGTRVERHHDDVNTLELILGGNFG